MTHPTARIVASLSHIDAGYAGRGALADVSLELHAGEIMALIGPNGAGKTTLLRVLAGLLAPSAGDVIVDGARRTAGEPRPVALVPQDIALYGWMSPHENCRAFARMAGASWREAGVAADRAVLLAHCADVASVPVARLSGGYKRRANIAAALIARPKLLILDEPTVGIDMEARDVLTKTLCELKEQGLAILLVTHDMDHADVLADRVAFLFSGRIHAAGQPSHLVTEMFGGRKRVTVMFADEPDGTQRSVLAELGATPTVSSTVWVLYRDLAAWDARSLVASLEQAHLVVREMTIRSPGLGAIYTDLAA